MHERLEEETACAARSLGVRMFEPTAEGLTWDLVKRVAVTLASGGIPERPLHGMWTTRNEYLRRKHWRYCRNIDVWGDPRECRTYEPLLKTRTKRSSQAVYLEHRHEFYSWKGAKRRCLNQNCKEYRYYGGRGITMYEPWTQGVAGFLMFLEHIGPRPAGRSLDRIDNDRGYEPGNVRWATPLEQASNRRCNRYVVLRGQRMTLAEMARLVGVSYAGSVLERLEKGQSPEEIEAFYAAKRSRR